MTGPWPIDWWSARQQLRKRLWRGVEAQHLVSTMHLVDDLEEQRTLEELLEGNKPRVPEGRPISPLLATPFRYRSPTASRFRKAGDAGIWYGAEEIETACTELAYWRHRFLTDSDGLAGGSLIVELTFFEATVDGIAIDLSIAPWDEERAAWTQTTDYTACQQMGEACRARADIRWIRYWSARHRPGHCAAVLDPHALCLVEPFAPQTWVFKVSSQRVLMEHYSDRLSLNFSA